MSICGWPHKDPCIVVEIGGIEAASSGSGSGYSLSVLDGWEGGAPVHGGPISFEQADGGARGDVYYGPRTLIIGGGITAHSHEDLADMIGELSNLARYETLTVDEAVHTGHVRQVEVVRDRPVQITQQSTTYATWTMTLRTVDWPRVGVDALSAVIGSGTVLRNAGTAPAYLSLALAGPLTNPGVTWSGGAWQYRGMVPAGTTLQVDMRHRVVRDPATSRRSRRLAGGDWPSLPPGDTAFTRTGTGAGTVTAHWRSTWA